MGLRFNFPWLLLLIVPLLTWMAWTWRRNLRLHGFRKGIAFGLRTMILILLILALSGIQGYKTIERQAVVFVMDESDSMPENNNKLDWIKAAAKSKKLDDSIGIVSGGLEAAMERALSTRGIEDFQPGSQLNREFTNLAASLQLAGSMLPEDADPRIVLLSDGRENVGDAMREANLLKDRGIPVDIVPIGQAERYDIAVESVKVPEKLYQAEKYALEVAIRSTYATPGILRVYEDNREISNQNIRIERGDNRFALQSLAREPGLHTYRAEIYADGDAQSANNAGYAFSHVTGPPKVLIVEGEAGSSRNLTSVLDSGLIRYDVIVPEFLPRELADYAAYESIILNNVSATLISEMQMKMIEQSVSDYGKGLVMIGGMDSYGLGGYFKTPIERALPVYMDLRGKREIPSLGLILVIDKSGSMDNGKIELAQEAAMRTADLMREKDTIGVLAFDSSPWWVVEPQKLTDRESVAEQIGSIQADGGTEIYTAVNEAYEKLRKVQAQRKHIILLTDGQSSTNQSYEALAADMVKNNITLSSVAIGQGADQQLLETIAMLAKGRYYFTDEQSTVPAIFSREAVLMSRTYIVDQPFVPVFGQGADWGALFQGGVPQIQAYIATTPKETAEVVLMSPEPDPLLARWQYGSGRSVAWTSDLTGKWSSGWIQWESFSNVFSQVLKWTFPQFQASPFVLDAHLNGNEVSLGLLSTFPDFKGDLQAVITNEALNKQTLPFVPSVPGQYEAKMTIREPGVYLTQIDVYEPSTSGGENSANGETNSSSQQKIGSMTTGFVVPYSPEYRILMQNEADIMPKLAEMTGGRLLSMERPEEVFNEAAEPRKQIHDLSGILIVTALLLWLLDIAVRRLSIPWQVIGRMVPFGKKRGEHHSRTSEVFSRLQQRKERLKQERQQAASDGTRMDKESTVTPRKKDNPFITGVSLSTHSSIEQTNVGEPTKNAQSSSEQTGEIPGVKTDEQKTETMNRLLAAKNRRNR